MKNHKGFLAILVMIILLILFSYLIFFQTKVIKVNEISTELGIHYLPKLPKWEISTITNISDNGFLSPSIKIIYVNGIELYISRSRINFKQYSMLDDTSNEMVTRYRKNDDHDIEILSIHDNELYYYFIVNITQSNYYQDIVSLFSEEID